MTIQMRGALASALCGILCALAAAQPPATGTKEPAKKDENVVKAFELKNANAGEIQQLLTKHTMTASGPKGGTAKTTLLVAVDPKSKMLFVRGAAADVETASKIITQLESGGDGPLQVIHLQNASVEDAMRVLTALELGGRVYPCQASKALVIPQGETHADQIKAVIEKLDGAKLAPKTGKPDKKDTTEPKKQ